MTDPRGTPEYELGYVHAIHGRPQQWHYLLDAFYQSGYTAGMKAIRSPVVKRRWWDFGGDEMVRPVQPLPKRLTMTREPGFYWVRFGADWIPSEWFEPEWLHIHYVAGTVPDEIDERRIERG